MTRKGQKLLGIQTARGVAALLVVLYHACRMIALPQYAGHLGLHGALEFGHAGVDFFFVLSGFIIYYVHHVDFDRPRNLARYAWRRVTRIYPSYWLVTAFVVVLLALKHDPALTITHLLKSFLLFPDTQDPFLSVAWTLIHEMLFYGIFAIAIINSRIGLLIALAITVFIIAFGEEFRDPVLKLIGAPRNLQFGIGIAAAYATLGLKIRNPLLLMGAGIVAFFGVGVAENAGFIGWDSTQSSMLFAAASGVIIAALAAAELEGLLRVGKLGEFFGGSSYLLYLVHTIVVGLTFHFLSASGLFKHGLPDWISILLATIASICVAALLYRGFERPLLSALHRLGSRPKSHIASDGEVQRFLKE
jgi:exopolysaccharide production protein ExoZ